MSLVDAVINAGLIPSIDVAQAQKKAYAERLSKHLSIEVAEGLRQIGFANVIPLREGPGEKRFQGGLGAKKVDVCYSDEQHGLKLAVSIKTICFPPYGKNLKNRFSDMCTESISLHMRFPYSVICGLFAFPADADKDMTKQKKVSTFSNATNLFHTISGRKDYSNADEKFESITMMLFEPRRDNVSEPRVHLVDSVSETHLTEHEYFLKIKDLYNLRNPHGVIE